MLRSDSPSGKCARLHVAAGNNRDHPTGSLYCCLFAPHRYGCYSSRTSRSWWIAHSTQHHRRGCNSCVIRIHSLRKEKGEKRPAWLEKQFNVLLLWNRSLQSAAREVISLVSKPFWQQWKNNFLAKNLLIWQNVTYPKTITLRKMFDPWAVVK